VNGSYDPYFRLFPIVANIIQRKESSLLCAASTNDLSRNLDLIILEWCLVNYLKSKGAQGAGEGAKEDRAIYTEYYSKQPKEILGFV